jgi:hypothetical protein
MKISIFSDFGLNLRMKQFFHSKLMLLCSESKYPEMIQQNKSAYSECFF